MTRLWKVFLVIYRWVFKGIAGRQPFVVIISGNRFIPVCQLKTAKLLIFHQSLSTYDSCCPSISHETMETFITTRFSTFYEVSFSLQIATLKALPFYVQFY